MIGMMVHPAVADREGEKQMRHSRAVVLRRLVFPATLLPEEVEEAS